MKLYIEISVWNFYYANDAPDFQKATITFFDYLMKNDVENNFISDVVLEEIEKAPSIKRKMLMGLIEKVNPKILEITGEVITLAEAYIDNPALPKRSVYDAYHAATSVVGGIDILVSMNMKHLANIN